MTNLPRLAQDALQLYPYGKSGHQRVNIPDNNVTARGSERPRAAVSML